jgi:2-amino-4-hydroxy-6-hydroxymethyldihydropteridine diphosphokinase
MSLIIATGSNLGDKTSNLQLAEDLLKKHFSLTSKSRIYHSKAVDYLDQPDFYNQVLEFETPHLSPLETLSIINQIEKEMGRIRNISKGPRIIDIDILFFDDIHIETSTLTIPHPRLFERSFVVLPLKELPGFESLSKKYLFNESFETMAYPLIRIHF